MLNKFLHHKHFFIPTISIKATNHTPNLQGWSNWQLMSTCHIKLFSTAFRGNGSQTCSVNMIVSKHFCSHFVTSHPPQPRKRYYFGKMSVFTAIHTLQLVYFVPQELFILPKCYSIKHFNIARHFTTGEENYPMCHGTLNMFIKSPAAKLCDSNVLNMFRGQHIKLFKLSHCYKLLAEIPQMLFASQFNSWHPIILQHCDLIFNNCKQRHIILLYLYDKKDC